MQNALKMEYKWILILLSGVLFIAAIDGAAIDDEVHFELIKNCVLFIRTLVSSFVFRPQTKSE